MKRLDSTRDVILTHASQSGYAAADTISFGGDFIMGGMGQDHISFGDDPYPTLGSSITGSRVQGGMGTDTITLSPYPHAPFNKVQEPSINKIGAQKYEEDKGIKILKIMFPQRILDIILPKDQMFRHLILLSLLVMRNLSVVLMQLSI